MNSVLVVMLSLFFVLSYKTCKASSAQVVEVSFADEEDPDPGTPLFLTPLIENGKIEEARRKAAVQHHEMGNVRSYSGYLTINKEYNSNLFFWFFPSVIYTETAPVVLWLQGGPGLTTMIGLFAEHGPFNVSIDGTLQKRDYSWHINHNIIYIDNPVGTGYSFTDNEKGYARNVTQIAKELFSALEQFFLLFSELQNNDFFVIGESYAGKYVTALSYAIKNHNIKAETKIHLKGLAIGNGFCDPENQLLYSDYLYQIGLINLNGKTEFRKYEETIRQFIKENNFIKAFEYYNKLFDSDAYNVPSLFHNLTGFHIDFNYLNSNLNYDIYYRSLWLFLNWIRKVDVRYAIHVGNNAFNLNSRIITVHLKEDYLQSVVVLLKELLDTTTYKVLIYNGQLDIIYAYPFTENYLQKMQWSGAEKYAKAPRMFWYVDNDLAGYTKSVDNLKFVLVRNAGRLVSTDQSKWVLDLIFRFTRNEKF